MNRVALDERTEARERVAQNSTVAAGARTITSPSGLRFDVPKDRERGPR
jgi:hypothetical protein